jgi:hypothetical protein
MKGEQCFPSSTVSVSLWCVFGRKWPLGAVHFRQNGGSAARKTCRPQARGPEPRAGQRRDPCEVEHNVSPPVRFYETKPHLARESALNRALAIYRNPGWGLKVLFIEQANGMRMEATEISAWCERAASER